MVFSGYVGQSNQEGSWIKTGDFAYIKNQHLFLVGRESDRIIVGESMYIQQLLKA